MSKLEAWNRSIEELKDLSFQELTQYMIENIHYPYACPNEPKRMQSLAINLLYMKRFREFQRKEKLCS